VGEIEVPHGFGSNAKKTKKNKEDLSSINRLKG